ncbi:TetR family transcriptional regulator [Rhodoblastus sphagnicola]|uniref:TetR family transcriptional regulator n=1 Tax=Rhodoblastus sphagnicola TaxID=333368 RepID=A0A2S6N617_9HYPH|nr:TetR/AcrR family transcriptional regulator [Rhodoblastus sphagnicola]MBB4196390.1 AcrR family transcriptional regulator [Rhodoblastus sphagnicola]PPQ30049.1 TetR family transcriptional regulator [Rhodoblastus sphagnicola]
MPRPRKREATDEAGENCKYRLILETARELFLQRGFDAASMDTIAREAGVSKATLYVHFASKDDLLIKMVDDACGKLGPQALWRPHDGPIDLEPALRQIARSYTAFFLDNRGLGLHRLIMMNGGRFPRIAETFMRAGPGRCEDEMAVFLETAVARGLLRIPDIRLAAVQFLSLVQGRLQLRWELSLGPPAAAEYEALIEGGVRVFLAAYR